MAAFELPGVMAHSLVVIQGSEHSTINTNEMAESYYGHCACYSEVMLNVLIWEKAPACLRVFACFCLFDGELISTRKHYILANSKLI